MKKAVSPIKSLILVLCAFACLFACGTKEPQPTPTPKPTTVAVTGVTLSKTSLSLVEGTSETLAATVSPENASNKSVSWKSSATDIATVDGSGKVTAVKAGSATVTVTTADGSKTATCSVTVTEAAKIVITGNTVKVPVSGGTAEFPIQYNTSYTVEVESSAQAWLHFVETKAMQSGTLVFSVDVNEGAARTGKATVKDNEGKIEPITLTFEQEAFEPSAYEESRKILMEIYQSMGGPDWKVQGNWGTDADLSTWAGVEFDSEQGVKSLRFSGFGLTGEIPESIGELTGLQSFYVQNEPGVTGTLPDSFLKLVKLESIELYQTSMTSLSDVFYNMKDLGYVFIYANPQMGGPLPESIGLSEKLYTFLIQDNAFTGAAPASWVKTLDLQGANLRYNRLSGAIPKAFLQGGTEQVGWRLATMLQQQEGYGFDINDIDIPGYWPKGAISDFDGKLFSFADVISKNEYTLYLNWATWCPYSAVLMPQIKAYYEQYKQDGLEIIATVWHPDEHDFSDSEKALEEKTIHEKGYDQWYNFFYGPYYGTMNISHNVPTAEVYDKSGNVLFSSVYYMPDPVRKRYGAREGDKSAFNDLIPFLETVLGPADPSGDYTSTDFSKDGQVLTLQKASVGKGINIVFLGDGYTDRDMGSGGLYETLMKQAMEEFFAIEPYKSFRNRFNVYAVKVVSKNGRIGEGYSTALGTTFGNGSEVNGDLNKCYEYAQKVPGITDTKNLLIPVMINTRRNAGTARMSELLQSSVSFFASFGNQAESFGSILRHEAGGHGFAFLADEYSSYDTPVTADIEAEYNRLYNAYGWYSNVDFTNDPDKIHWSVFLSDDRYKNEVGIYEGGALYAKGVWRPTQNSMMNEDAPYFNAPSRWAIYKRIMELSGEEYSFEKFMEYDAVNRASSN